MSYATPSTFRAFGLPPGALEGVEDAVIQTHLDAASRQIDRRLRGRNLVVPVTGAAAAELAADECKLAAWTLLTLYKGAPADDPAVSGYREMAKEALAEVDEIASGLLNMGADKASAHGGGLIQAIPPSDVDGNDEASWWG